MAQGSRGTCGCCATRELGAATGFSSAGSGEGIALETPSLANIHKGDVWLALLDLFLFIPHRKGKDSGRRGLRFTC